MPGNTRKILINIGNTHVQVAVDTGDTPRLLERYDTAHIKVLGMLPILENMPVDWQASAVSVVPMLQRELSQRYGDKLKFLSVNDFPQLDFSQVDTSTLGMDRIANAAAAFALAKSAVIVIDFGTCINTVVVNAEGRFLGGAILPGRTLLRKSLSTYTAQLPFLPLRDKVPPPMGSNTLDAMAAGVDLGVIGTVRELLTATRRFLEPSKCTIMTAGGDAPFFLENLPELTEGPGLLTLRGVAQAR